MAKLSRAAQIKAIKEAAESNGVQANFFFVSTLERYEMQLKIISGLEKTIKKEGLLVEKEYVKGRKNLYSNPAVAEYNRTTDSANKTVATLMRIIKGFGANDEDGDEDPLMAIINGS